MDFRKEGSSSATTYLRDYVGLSGIIDSTPVFMQELYIFFQYIDELYLVTVLIVHLFYLYVSYHSADVDSRLVS